MATPGRRASSPGPGSGGGAGGPPGTIEVLLAIWERVLDRTGVGPGDDFFALGGDQFGASRALELVEDAFGVCLDVATMLRSPSAGALTAVVDQAVASGSTAERAGTGGVAPVAPSQEGMLWHEYFVPGSQNLPPLVRRYQGALDLGALERALAEIVRRHEPLRSTFELRRGRPVQRVAAAGPRRLEVHDLGGLDAAAQDDEMAGLLAAAGRPFDLARGPLFDPSVVRLGPRDHLVVLRVHHAVFDDWSVGVFRRELMSLYAAFASGAPSPLPEPGTSFGAFARGQRRRLAGPVGTAQLAWWRQELAGAPWCLQLPVDDPDRPEGVPQPSAVPVTLALDPGLCRRIRALARRERTTPFMTVLAAFAVLAQRHSGQSDLLAATVVANRNRTELESLIGCFTKKVLVRLRLHGDPTFAELLARVRASLVGALAHQDLAFETVLQQVIGPGAARHGLVPYPAVMFQGVAPPAEEVVLPGLVTSGFDTSATTARAHFASGEDAAAPTPAPPWGGGLYSNTFLILSMLEDPAEPGGAPGAGITLSARGAFHHPSVVALLDRLATLLAEVVDHPASPLSARGPGPEPDRSAPPPDDASLLGLFEAQVARTPGATAVGGAGQQLTYARLDADADALAARLASLGVRPGMLVGICLEPSPQAVVAVLAVWKAGAGYVALHPEDTDRHLIFVVEDSGISVVLTRAHLRRDVVERRARLVAMDPAVIRVVGGGGGPPAHVPAAARDAADPAGVATVFYGSGPSEVERGVVVAHASVLRLVAALRDAVLGPGPQRRVCLSAPPTDDAFLRQLAAVLAGHPVEVAGPATVLPAPILDLVAAGRVDVVDCTGPEWARLAAEGLAEALERRLAVPGVAPATLVVGSRGRAPAAGELPELRGAHKVAVHHLFGPPESGFGAALGPLPSPGRRATIGRPLRGVRAVVLGADGHPVPDRVVGELYLVGAGLARGYHAAPDWTEARFPDGAGTDDPGEGGAGPGRAGTERYRTGWLARLLPDGSVELQGASEDSLVLGGFRLDRARMQAAMGTCPGVRSVRVAVGTRSGGAPEISARVVPAGGDPPSLGALRAALWAEEPGYAWPAATVLTGPGTEDGGGAAPGHPGAPSAGAVYAPTAVEGLLSSLWAEALGVDRVDPATNYWQVFSFLDVVRRAREEGIGISGGQVTRNRTIAALAADVGALRPR